MQIDRQMFDHYQYRTRGGIYTHDPEMVALSNELEEIRKARNGTLTDIEQRIEAKAGSLFSVYSAIWGNLLRYGAADKPAGTESHKNLRQYAKQSIIDALIINARLYQIRHFARQVIVEGKQKGFVVRHRRHSDKTFIMTREIENTCREISDVVFNPNKDFHPEGFRDVLVKFAQGEMVIDRKAIVVMRTRQGKPLSWHVLPPDDIRPRLEVLLRHMPETRLPGLNSSLWSLRNYRTPEAQQKIAGQLGTLRRADYDRASDTIFQKFGVDVSSAAWVQDIDGIVTGAWAADECKIDVTAPSDEINMWRYGCSSLERSLEVSSMLIYAINYNRSLFTKNYPEAMLMLHGNVNTAGLEVFKAQLYSEVGPEMGAARLPVLSTGSSQFNKAELLKLRDSIRDMEMPQFIRLFASLKTAAFRCHPSILNLNPDKGESRPVISNMDEAFNVDLSQEEGLGSLVETSADFLTRALWGDYEPWQDYCLVAVTNKILTEPEVIELWDKKLKSGAYVVDEMRTALGDQPLEKVSDVKGTYSPNNFFFQAQTAQQQQSEQELQQLLAEPSNEQGWTAGDNDTMDFEQPQQQWTLGA